VQQEVIFASSCCAVAVGFLMMGHVQTSHDRY